MPKKNLRYEKSQTCRHVIKTGVNLVYTTKDCPKINGKINPFIRKMTCSRCRQWKPKEEIE